MSESSSASTPEQSTTLSCVVPLLPEVWVKISSFAGYAGLTKEQRIRLEQAIEEAAHLLGHVETGTSGPYTITLSRMESHLQVDMGLADPSPDVSVPDEKGLEWRLLRRLADGVKFDSSQETRGPLIELAYILVNAPKPRSQSLEIDLVEEEEMIVVSLVGRLDSLTAPELDDQLAPKVEQGKQHLLLDTAELEYLSSAGLRLFAKYAKAMEKPRLFALLRPSDRVRDVMLMAGLDRQIPSFSNAQAALSALKSGM